LASNQQRLRYAVLNQLIHQLPRIRPIKQETFKTPLGFLMAAVGFAVGLGNIWRFPYITGENGGAAFVLVYLACVLIIGLPIVMSEIALGRRGQGDPLQTFGRLAKASGAAPLWRWVGGLNLLTAFLIMATYATVAGWVLYYLWSASSGAFSSIDEIASNTYFETLLASPVVMFMWMALAMTLTGIIISGGVQKGIERAVRVLMPLLFLLMLALVVYNAFDPSFWVGWDYLFQADFSKITPQVFLAAIGQAFFSIGVAMAGLMIFGAYLPPGQSIVRYGFLIIVADTAIALLAGLMIFPLVFRYGLDPAGGVGLIFKVLPIAFGQLPFGALVGGLFFLLLSVAAMTSMVGFVEPLVATLARLTGMSRLKSTWLMVLSLILVSLMSILTYSAWSSLQIWGRDLNGLIDFISNQLLLPIGGLLIAIFAGWVLKRDQLAAEVVFPRAWQFKLWYGLLKYPLPCVILVILISGLAT
jgi:NSS family neurotransmitter:Na+ symporter